MACKGNASEYCGGAGRMNLYSYNGATPVQVQAAPAATSSSVSAPANIPAGWATLGCYTDSDNPAKRALGAFFTQPSGGMTVETCINLCSTNGYTIAGVEYSTECYCDTEIRNNQGLAADGNTGCNMACSGNAGETCGGPNRLNVYAAGGEWVQLGCYSDQPYSRTLAYTLSYAGQLTTDTCLSTCRAAGYPYAGTEYGNECHCGSSFDNGGGVASDGNAGCSFACAGNSSEICGGSQRLSMYEYINTDGTVSNTAPASSTSPVASSPTTTTTSSPVATTLPSDWQHSACYVDQTNGRILPQQQPDSSSLTPVSCINTCAAAGYSVAGVEYSSQCFCGNAIVNGGAPASDSVAASQCHMACSGDSTESCGGPGLMDIYYTGTLTTQAAAAPQTSGLPSTWQYAGCLSDNVNSRTLPVQINVANNDATTCLNACAAQSYSVAGLEYGSQCFCGALSYVAASGATTSTQCSMTCAGDSSYLCGGPGAMNYYTL
ncbi:hypothetical protein LTR86_000340 [Recurvomyces mirabilis]|nr:hypothetical protein LTR86_000340 [Recurvomyces mirabilis]